MTVGRFAPSPSGRMHLGNVFTALLAWLSVRSQGGEMLLRIEDLDPERSKEEYIEALRDAIDPALPLGLGEVPYGPLQVMHLQADTSALQEDTGWRPATPFEEGIRETIEWVRKETK